MERQGVAAAGQLSTAGFAIQANTLLVRKDWSWIPARRMGNADLSTSLRFGRDDKGEGFAEEGMTILSKLSSSC